MTCSPGVTYFGPFDERWAASGAAPPGPANGAGSGHRVPLPRRAASQEVGQEHDEELSHLIEAGADCLLMPSIYEPCGLNQLYSLQYGTIPIVRKTGGLADTVRDASKDPVKGNGFVFEPAESAALRDAIKRALAAYEDKEFWHALQQRGMMEDFSWEASAKKYLQLYELACSVKNE